VTVPIPPDGVGEVACAVGGQTTRRMARAAAARTVPEGAGPHHRRLRRDRDRRAGGLSGPREGGSMFDLLGFFGLGGLLAP